MGAVYLTSTFDWLRAAGLDVVEYDEAWRTRARSSGGFESGRPWVVMWHHTASRTSPVNDCDYMVHGSSDRPIANVLIARDGIVWLMAAGATNTNGKGHSVAVSKGNVPADSMNTYAFGMEIANDGVGEVYPQIQIDAAFTVSLTMQHHLGLAPTDCETHADYAPDRKIDPATAAAVQGPWRPASVTSSGTWSVDDLRAEHTRRSSAPPDQGGDVEQQAITDATRVALNEGTVFGALSWAETNINMAQAVQNIWNEVVAINAKLDALQPTEEVNDERHTR